MNRRQRACWVHQLHYIQIITKSSSPDNSRMEGFLGTVKNELFRYRCWEGVGLDEFMSLPDEYLRYCNDVRIRESLGWMSTLDYHRSLRMTA